MSLTIELNFFENAANECLNSIKNLVKLKSNKIIFFLLMITLIPFCEIPNISFN